jgi:2-C-methyl-D-erythritol 4-phosphate cytidylyltransferase
VHVWGIVLAAGDARRFGSLKQFANLGGRSLVDRVVQTPAAACDAVVVVVHPDTSWNGPPVAAVVSGGPTRAGSMRCGLRAIPPSAEIIVVHDAAHPLATRALFESVIEGVAGGADAAIPAFSLLDPIKRVRGGRVVHTLHGGELMMVQTPHAFRAEVLRRVHEGGDEAIEDSAMVERMGGTIVVVPGDPRNLHVTTPLELEMAALLLGAE